MNYKSLILKLLLIWFFFVRFATHSQNVKLDFEEFVIEDGLASVNCILKDRNGFMWFGGTHGLYRYDGFKFKIFTSHEGNLFSLSNNNVVCLFEDNDGYIWVGTRQGGINMFDPLNESFTNHNNNKTKTIFNTNYITSITQDTEGIIWFGTFGNGVYALNKKNNSVQKYSHYANNVNSVSNNDIFSIIPNGNKIWITSNAGVLDCYDKEKNMFYHYEYSSRKYHSTRTGQRLCFDYKNNLWIATEEEGLFKFNINSKTFIHFKHEKGEPSISSNIITDIKEGKPNELWLTTDGGGLNLLNTNTGEISVYKNNIYDKKSLTNNSSYCLFIDSNFNLWMGMGDGSVNKTTNSPFEVYQTSSLTPSNSLSFNVVVSLFMNNDILWIGTGGGGLDRLDIKTNTFINYKNDPNNDASLPSDIIMTVIEDTDGTIWSGNFKKGISFKNKETNDFFPPKFNISNAPSLEHNLVFDLVEDNNNTIWIATYDNGLYRYNKTTKKIKHFNALDNQTGLKSNKLLRLLIDSSGLLWIGSLNLGVFIYNLEDKKFYSIQEYLGLKNSLNIKAPIKDLFEDVFGNIWIATEGNGVYVLNVKNKSLDHYNTLSGLPSNSIYGVIQDNYNNYWFSTNKGIASLNTKNDKILIYNTFDGLPSNDFESGAIAKASDGKLFFGSKKGLVAFYPNQLNIKPEPINLKLTNFQIFNKDIRVNETMESYIPLDTSIVFINNIKLPYFLDNFSFEFATPGYPSPHNITYEYMLEGLDDRWITTASEHHFASYSNIPPGSYIFKVKATEENSIEMNNLVEKHINIIITPVWWQTKIAYIIYFLILTALLYFIYYSFKNRIHLKNELLIEKYKHEKDEELHQSKINFFTTISHELRTSLTLILTPLEELTKIKNTNNRVSNLVMTMNRNGHRLLSLVTQILDFRKMESSVTKLKVAKVDIKSFFDELCIPFYQYAKEKGIHFQLTVSNSCEKGWIDTSKLEIIIYNLLSNAFKFAKSKIDINVDLDEKDERLIIKIKDNGKGISSENISKIFQDFYQINSKENNSNVGSGIGLAITKNLTNIHYGEISVKSEEEEYTIFIVIIPITKKFYNDNEIIDSPIDINLPINNLEEKFAFSDINTSNALSDEKPILLVVEDNFEIRNLIKNHFSNNYKVITSTDGIQGCHKAFDTIPDIIISDIMMPEMNGLELCKKLKTDSRTSHIPIILLTARGSHTFQMEGLEYGADDYITKPFNLEILNVRVKNLIDSRKALRDIFRKEVLLKPKDVAINNVDEIFIEKIVQIIENHMSDSKFSVSKLASEIGMSHSVLYRKIMALSGQNVNEFIKTMKLTRAAQLISDSHYSINEISDMTGFSNPKYFSTCFKQKYNLTPTQYREKKNA